MSTITKERTKEQLIEDLKASTQNASGMFEISEDTICALMSMLTNAAPQLPQPAVPDEMPAHIGPREFGRPQAYIDGWNACRAAMLQCSEPLQEWIPCSERMPDKLIPVMVMYEDGEMWSAMWNGNRWDDGTEYPDPHSVTHWREMPAAPQQEVNRG